MANDTASGPNYEQAIINAAPGASGYWTDPVNPRGKSASGPNYEQAIINAAP